MHAMADANDSRCVDCDAPMTLEPPREYGGPFWLCRQCHATVVAHPITGQPLGPMGDRATRGARRLAHHAVAPLWERHGMSRDAVYRWIAAILGVAEAQARIAMLSREQCERVVVRVERLLSKLGGY